MECKKNLYFLMVVLALFCVQLSVAEDELPESKDVTGDGGEDLEDRAGLSDEIIKILQNTVSTYAGLFSKAIEGGFTQGTIGTNLTRGILFGTSEASTTKASEE